MEIEQSDEQRLFSQAFEFAPIGMSLVSMDGSILKVNPSFCRFIGYTEDELKEKNLAQITHPEDWKQNLRFIQQLFSGSIETYQMEKRFTNKNGNLLWGKISASLVRDQNGDPLFIIGQLIDMTKEKAFKDQINEYVQQLQNKEKHLIQAQRMSRLGSWEYDVRHHKFYISDEGRQILGMQDTENFLRSYQDSVYPDDRLLVNDAIRQAVEGKDSRLECRFIRSDGEIRYIQAIFEPVFDENDSLYKIIGTTQDITGRVLSEQKMREHEDLYMLISENAQDIISYSTPDGICRFVSPSIKHLGYDPEEVIGKRTTDYWHPDDLSLISKDSTNNADDGLFECRIRHKEGHYIWLETTTKKIRNEQGEVEKILGIGRDITAKKQAEEELKKSEEKYRLLADHSTDLITKRQINGPFTYISPSSLILLGFAPEELLSREPCDFVHPDDYPILQDAFKKQVENNHGTSTCMYRLRRKDGSYIWVETVMTVIRDPHTNEPVKMLTSSRDITKRKEDEFQLKQREEQYRMLVETSMDTIGVTDGNVWLFLNQAGVRMFGAGSLEELIGESIKGFLHPDFHEACMKRVEGVLKEGKAAELVEQKWYTVDGRIFDGEVIGIPILFEDRPAVQVLIRDITQRKKAEYLMVQSEKLSVISQLAAGIAHEIRNPLTAIKGFIQLIKDRIPEEAFYFSIMIEEIKRVEIILNELLVLSKPKGVQWGERNIHIILEHVTALLKTQAIIHNIDIQTAFESKELNVWCDENSLKQVFINLIKNAIEAMANGGEIRLETEQVNGQVVIRVTDQGCGIPKDKLSRLGTPFYTTKANGTGLGMMISYNIIEQHKGRIHIDSEVNIGTTFTVTLPQASASARDA